MSPSYSARTTLVGNTKVFILLLDTIFLVVAISFSRFGIIPLEGHTYNACSYALISFNSSIPTLCTGFLLSRNSFSKIFAVFWLFVGMWRFLTAQPFALGGFYGKFHALLCLWKFPDLSFTLAIASWVAPCFEAIFCPWHVLSSSLVSRRWISLFHCCATILSNVAMFGVRHSKGHVSNTS